jgi:glyoxylase I family protein
MKDPLLHEIQQLEQRLLQPEVRTSTGALNELIADDFLEIGVSGRVYTRQEIIDSLPEARHREYTLIKCHAVRLAPDMALLNYRLATTGGAQRGVEYSVRSSIWKLINGRWKIVFHQGTREAPDNTGM